MSENVKIGLIQRRCSEDTEENLHRTVAGIHEAFAYGGEVVDVQIDQQGQLYRDKRRLDERQTVVRAVTLLAAIHNIVVIETATIAACPPLSANRLSRLLRLASSQVSSSRS